MSAAEKYNYFLVFPNLLFMLDQPTLEGSICWSFTQLIIRFYEENARLEPTQTQPLQKEMTISPISSSINICEVYFNKRRKNGDRVTKK